MIEVIVREFACLTTSPIENGLDQATLTPSAFDWLCEERVKLRKDEAEPIRFADRRSLRLDSYVGVIQTPCGTRIEVLPKILDGNEEVPRLRRILRKMLASALDLTARELPAADIDVFDGPLTEWVAARFLASLDRLIKRGLRFEYQRVEEEQPFLRGRLDVARQLRQPPGKRHLFRIQHDVFEPDRPENRLLHSALDQVRRFTRSPANWRLAHELASYLAPVPFSGNIAQDFSCWRDERLMAHYRAVRPWCALILNEQVPLSMIGTLHGPSFLFPMEKLFERYVAGQLRKVLLPGARLTCTAREEHLCKHKGDRWFRLEPDMLIRLDSRRWVLDAKWKRLDSARGNSEHKYDISQGDVYQMFAYGQKYLDGTGDLVLIYPKTNTLPDALERFDFSETLRLWVVPFDLKNDVLAPHGAGLPLKAVAGSLHGVELVTHTLPAMEPLPAASTAYFERSGHIL
jgi:5-methylcytosine-specific restriction enzyme subunit McrC